MDTLNLRGARVALAAFACAFCVLARPALAEPAAPLGLEAQVDGAWIKVLGVDQKRLIGEKAAGTCTVPATAPLRLVGDLMAHPEIVEANAAFDLTEFPAPTDSTRPTRWLAQSIHLAADVVAGPKAQWHPVQPAKAVLVCVWQVAGQPTQLRSIPLQAFPDGDYKTAWISLELTPAESAGNPVFLLFEDGRPLARQLTPAAATGDRCGVLAVLGQDEALAAELRRLGKVPPVAKDMPALLLVAAQAGAVRSVDALLQLGDNVKVRTGAGDTALHLAAGHGRTAVVERLVAAKAPLGAANSAKDTPLHLAANGAHAESCRLLIEAGAPVGSLNEFNTNPAFRALAADCTPAVELFLARKADFGFNDFIRDRLLVRKASGGQRRLVQILLARHADPNAQWLGQTPLQIASREGYEGIVADLLAAKANPNLAGPNGTTPLLAAAGRGHAAVVRQLLAAGADPAQTSNGGYAPLHAASFAGSAPTVQALLAAGVPADTTTAQGVTALTFALGSASRETVDALLAAGAKVDFANPRFDAELNAALAMDSEAFVAAALKAGMPVDHRTEKGWSALQLATIGKAERCAELLRAAGAQAPDPAAAAAVVPGSQLEKRPALLELHPTIDPRDPEESDFAATTVVVEALVGKDGIPAFARATCEDCRLSLSAVQTVLRSRFQPARKGGEPVATQVRIPIVFRERAKPTFEFQALDVKPQVIVKTQVPPRYPFELKKRGIMGQAVVQFFVTEGGSVEEVIVVSATDKAFGDSALEAVRHWRFKPGILDGKAVTTRMQQAFPFQLR